LMCGVSLLSSGLSAAFHAYSNGALSAIGELSVVGCCSWSRVYYRQLSVVGCCSWSRVYYRQLSVVGCCSWPRVYYRQLSVVGRGLGFIIVS
jgi:hypothetical protein